MIKPFEKEFLYYGKRMRPYYKVWGIAVSEDGKTVLRHYEKDFGSSILPQRPAKRLSVQTDKNGECYVNTQDKGRLYVAVMVAACFCPPCPAPQQDYELCHKDGNQSNCHYKNLEWRKKTPIPKVTIHTTAQSVKLSNGLTVHRNGTVYDKKQKLPLENSIYDPDTDLFWSIQPKVSYYRPNKWKKEERLKAIMDDLMAAAGYVAEEKYQFQNPVILHLDGNWLNFDSSNLEWCDASDPRYTNYVKKLADDMKAWNIANNKDFPNCYK